MNVFLIISISTILIILILLLRYLIVSIEDLKAQIVAYKEQIIKGQSYTDDLLNDIFKDVEYIRANINHKDMYNTCIELIGTIHNTLLDYINKAGRLGESTTNHLININNEIPILNKHPFFFAIISLFQKTSPITPKATANAAAFQFLQYR